MPGSKSHWENVYADTGADAVSWFQRNPASSLAFIQKYAPSITAPIIDIGAGASLLVDRLLDAGFEDISLLDISEAALRETRRRLGVKASRVTAWLAEDITKFTPDRRYSVWHDRAVLHFLTRAEDQQAYARALARALPVGGYFIASTFALDGPKTCSGLSVRRYDTARMQAMLGSGFKLIEAGQERHHTPGGSSQNFANFVFEKIEVRAAR
jgi:SAM-dependent methyltransferase